MSGFLFLAALLVSHPGTIDPYGGHAAASGENYHYHSGPSLQNRSVDAAGLVRHEIGPDGEGNNGVPNDSGIFSTPFLLYIFGAATGAGLLSWWIEEWWRGRRRHHRKRRSHAQAKPPSAFLPRTASRRLAG